MGVTTVRIKEYKCDGCNVIQLGELGDNVVGIEGVAMEHTISGGAGAKWFACSRRCVAPAVGNAIDLAREE